ncbi:MAG: hypothetical protein Q9212_007173 [Teloschistes hypoglaucus]
MGMTGKRLNGGTTIAGTMILAHLAGIRIFATGGLGGVHRGAENSMDISADLTELGRTPVTVISSGCKSFLDIPRTLEYLETQGVGVGTFADGREGKVDIPALWTRESGIQSPTVIQDEIEAAAIIFAQSSLGLSSGLHFANPISQEHSIPRAQMDSIIEQAILDAEKSGSTGSDNTPFILAKIRELTGGRTVTANRVLIESNVIRGTKVACELVKLEAQSGRSPDYRVGTVVEEGGQGELQNAAPTLPGVDDCPVTAPDVFVAGSLALDLSCDYIPMEGGSTSISPVPHTSNPARISQGLGGVGRNIATALQYIGAKVQLCSATGDDVAGIAARNMLAAQGLSLSGIIKKPCTQTAQYVAVNDARKDLVLAMADMSVIENCKSEIDTIWKARLEESKPRWLVVDANWDPLTLHRWIMHGKAVNSRIAFEPVSVDKSRRLFASHSTNDFSLGVLPDNTISLASPNRLELASMHTAAREAGIFDRDDWWQIVDAMGLSSSGSRDRLVSIVGAKLVDEGVPQQSIQLLPFIPTILTKLGDKGVLITQMLRRGDDRLTARDHSKYVLSRADTNDELLGGIYMRLLAPAEKVSASDVVSVNGAGDTFLGVVIAGLAKDKPKSLVDLVHTAQQGSRMTLKSTEAVSPEISTLRDRL